MNLSDSLLADAVFSVRCSSLAQDDFSTCAEMISIPVPGVTGTQSFSLGLDHFCLLLLWFQFSGSSQSRRLSLLKQTDFSSASPINSTHQCASEDQLIIFIVV